MGSAMSDAARAAARAEMLRRAEEAAAVCLCKRASLHYRNICQSSPMTIYFFHLLKTLMH